MMMMMIIPSALFKHINKEGHLNVYRVKKNKEGADGWNISMAAGSLFHSCTTRVPCWEKGGFIKKLPLLSVELPDSEERGKHRGNHK